jgi:alpha-D-ribose 1-methylphosphonate 5-triphosphate synthase subunit PhnL
MRKNQFLSQQNKIIYLGNIIDSSSMTVKLSEDKIKIIIEECHALIKKSKATIRLVSRVIGVFPIINSSPS